MLRYKRSSDAVVDLTVEDPCGSNLPNLYHQCAPGEAADVKKQKVKVDPLSSQHIPRPAVARRSPAPGNPGTSTPAGQQAVAVAELQGIIIAKQELVISRLAVSEKTAKAHCSKLQADVNKVMTSHRHALAENIKLKADNSDKEQLKLKIAQLEDELLCPVCMDKKRGLAFGCGHQTCTVCGQAAVSCPTCRTKVVMRLQLF